MALLLTGGLYVKHASGESVVITTTIEAALTFTTNSSQFGTLNPGTPKFATTSLSVTTNSSTGWNIELFGDDVTDTVQAMDLDTDTDVEITDLDPQWIPGAATSSAGNAVAITSGQDVLAFRVMSASGTAAFLAPTWWGSDDSPYTNARWAGIASTTASNNKIGETDVPSDAGGAVNTVQYYLDVPTSQEVGSYSAPLTYTATVNP
jgi:hypothetical protein